MTNRDAFAWSPILAKRHDEDAPRIERIRSYVNGNPPLPEMTKNTRASWAAFQRKATMNLGGLIVSSACNRIQYSGIVIGTERAEAETLARRILRDNRFKSVLAQAIEWAVTDGEAYLMYALDEDGKPVATAESAQYVTVAKDPLRPWKARALQKVWRDLDEGMDYAFTFDGTYRLKEARPIRDKKKVMQTRVSGGGWEPIELIEVGEVPVVILSPTADGHGAFEPHMDVIDRCHLTLLNRITTMAMQAHRQRAVKGAIPDEDEQGNPVDLAAMFEPAPGAFWQLPDGIDIWESQTTDIQPMLTAAKDDLRDLAAVSRTSLSNLNPEGANQSAEGSRSSKDGEISRSTGYLDRMLDDIARFVVKLVKLADPKALTEDDTVTVLFKPPAVSSPTEATQAMVQAKAADIPWRTRVTEYGGFSADQADRMELERAQEMLDAAGFAPDAPAIPAAIDPVAVKQAADAMGVLIRSGVSAESAAAQVGLDGVQFTGAVPTSLRLPVSEAAGIED